MIVRGRRRFKRLQICETRQVARDENKTNGNGMLSGLGSIADTIIQVERNIIQGIPHKMQGLMSLRDSRVVQRVSRYKRPWKQRERGVE